MARGSFLRFEYVAVSRSLVASHVLVWEKNYARFYGEVNPRMAAVIKDWSFTVFLTYSFSCSCPFSLFSIAGEIKLKKKSGTYLFAIVVVFFLSLTV
jgi:hypothetical protein